MWRPMSTKPSLVPNPCPESWDSLTPEDRGHFCAACQTKVWDLSSMTEAEGSALVRERGGDLCVSYRERPDGSGLRLRKTLSPRSERASGPPPRTRSPRTRSKRASRSHPTRK